MRSDLGVSRRYNYCIHLCCSMSLGPLGNGPFPVGNRERGWGWLIKSSAQWQVFAFLIVPKDSKSLTRGCVFSRCRQILKPKLSPGLLFVLRPSSLRCLIYVKPFKDESIIKFLRARKCWTLKSRNKNAYIHNWSIIASACSNLTNVLWKEQGITQFTVKPTIWKRVPGVCL